MQKGILSDYRAHAVHVLHRAEAQLKNVKPSGHAITGFLCTHKGSKLELHQCESGDKAPYACIKTGVMERVNCHPEGSSTSLEDALHSHMLEMILSEIEDA